MRPGASAQPLGLLCCRCSTTTLKRIVQTDDYVMILAEMIHDAPHHSRSTADHDGAAGPKWLGDSVGHWEGDTLVVESRHFKDGSSALATPGNASERWSQATVSRSPSASLRSPEQDFVMSSQCATPRFGQSPGAANSLGPQPTRRSSSTPATEGNYGHGKHPSRRTSRGAGGIGRQTRVDRLNPSRENLALPLTSSVCTASWP